MRIRLHLLGIAVLLTAVDSANAAAQERNFWPFRVTQLSDSGTPQSFQGLGPLWFSQPWEETGTAGGVRPFWVTRSNPATGRIRTTILYPLMTVRRDPGARSWSILNIINSADDSAGDRHFDVWPFYFSRVTDDPATTYRAFFPIAGEVRDRLFRERIKWRLFPLYFETEANGVIARSYLWPFVRTASGAGVDRFALWPFFGWKRVEGISDQNFAVWPFYYHNRTGLDQEAPVEALGVLPFYTSEQSADLDSRTYLWPFFGYTDDRRAPEVYHETRYFWPFLVQSQGSNVQRNRWAPFYTWSLRNGREKRWWLWPLVRREQWADGGLERIQTRVLWFLFRGETQRSLTSGAAASKSHLWPLYSRWDNGAGHRQLQVLSVLTPVFPTNEGIQLQWEPLFSLYRKDSQETAGTARTSLLFDFLTWRTAPGESEFHLGPLLSLTREDSAREIELAGGLLRLSRDPDSGWRSFWFDFAGKTTDNPAPVDP